MESIEFTDRYQALGVPYPNPWTACKSRCQGLGCEECADTGRRIHGRLGKLLDYTYTYYYQLWFPFWALYAETIKGYNPPVREHPAKRLLFWFRFIHGEQRRQRFLIGRSS
jgi:hypothetical protein